MAAAIIGVAGDEVTGLYRRRDAVEDAGVLTLAYSWGQLTAGVRAKKDLYRALWMLLLPMALVNVAFWARPSFLDMGTETRTAGLASWLARVLAVSLTVTLVLAATGVGVDMLGWQWQNAASGARVEEVKDLPWAAFLLGDWWASGSRALGAGLMVPAVALLVLFVVARRSFSYEAEAAALGRRRSESGMPLTSPSFWRGERQVRSLAAAHLAIASASACAVAARIEVIFDGGRVVHIPYN